jgi:hypothetical protein
MNDNRELDGRRAPVAAGTQGIGHAVAAQLRKAGVRVLTMLAPGPMTRPRKTCSAVGSTHTRTEMSPPSVVWTSSRGAREKSTSWRGTAGDS